jgi:benzylsuccinate CoA-transferase BbsF subunit
MEAMGIAPSWTDPLTGIWEALIVQAALQYRARTGRGLAVDMSMVESTIPMMGDVFLEIVTGARPAQGQAPHACVPRGIYPCSGEDAWIAISVRDESEWGALCKVFDAPTWCRAEELRSAEGRRRNRERVDAWLAEATARRSAGALFHELQAAGVPAAPCYTLTEIIGDPQMQARGLFGELALPGGGVQVRTALPWREEGAEWKGTLRPAPALGQHNDYVFRDILALSEEEYDSYRREGAIE